MVERSGVAAGLNVDDDERERVALSRTAIVDAVLRVTLDEPRTPLTLARLGAELGADPTAVYRYYRNRDEMLLDVLDRVYGDALEVAERGEWKADLMAMATSVRAAMLRRPCLAAEVGSRFSGGPNERAGLERLVATFRAAGFPEDELRLQARAFGAFMLASVVASAAALTNSDDAHARDMLVVGSLFGPEHVTSADAYEEATFELMLRTHIAGLETVLDQHMHRGDTP